MNDLEELKSLLFGAEKQALDSILERVQKPETRSVDVADILPEAVRRSHRQGGELATSLREPVSQCLHESFRESPQEYADALYPVMGPAIRKSIMHALRGFAQQINETIEQSLSARGLKWRFEAWRTGIPFGEYVLQQMLLYRIEQAYLISRKNGLLISHVHHDASRIKDADAVSAMFTAIQDFVTESFSPDRNGRLETADMGDFTLWAVHGPHALLVCVIRGVPPRSLRADLSGILERIHFRYGQDIRDYNGDTSSVHGVEDELVDCLKFQAMQQRHGSRGRISVPVMILLFAVAATLIYFGISHFVVAQQHRALAAAIEATPGYYVPTIRRNGDNFVLQGLRDPLAAGVDEIAVTTGIDPNRISAELRPYQSLDSEIVLRRTLNLLDLPPTVSITDTDTVLHLSGSATQAWMDSVRNKMSAGMLGLPVDIGEVTSTDLLQLRAEVEKINTGDFYFSNEAEFRQDDVTALRSLAVSISELISDARRLERPLLIEVHGHTDGAGSMAFNRELAERRAEAAIRILVDEGIDETLISRSVVVPSDGLTVADPDLRKVSVRLLLGTGDALNSPSLE